ncbi:MAG: lamin tail domain-containing protein, partial [Bacteroidota bacterium]
MRSIQLYVFFAILLFASGITSAQLSDDFADGDFTSGTAWTGDDSFFVVESEVLRSNIDPGDDAINYYLSTPNTLIDDVQWEFWINLDFATSGANYADIYLVADNADLSAAQNGYFIRFGETEDEISFYKLLSGSETILIDGPDGQLGSSNNIFRVRMTRTSSGDWSLEVDEDDTGVFEPAGNVNDNDIGTTSSFGIRIQQSSAASPVNNHFFDDFVVDLIPVDETPPTLVFAVASSSTEISLQFSEAIDESTVTTTSNYSINGGIGNPSVAVLNSSNPNEIELTLSTPLSNGQEYEITVSGVADLAANAVSNETATFTFFVPDDPQAGDVIFNELLPDPNPSEGLPEEEFIELFNRSDLFFDLEGWILVNTSTERVLTSVTLPPNGYLILCDAADVDLYNGFGTVMGIPSFTALSNAADSLTLIDGGGEVLDIVSYTTDWYQDPNKDDGGFTLERINPTLSCSGASNWLASSDPLGGTPGSQNSVFDDTPDTTPPGVENIEIVSSTELLLNLNEPLEEDGVSAAVISISPDLGIAGFFLVQSNQVQVTLSNPLEFGTLYTVSVQGLSDCEGNVSAEEQLEIFQGETPESGDIVISEIMADPNPPTGLPEVEYFELFNRSTKTLELQGCELSGISFDEPLIMEPNSYLVFASDDNQGLLLDFPQFIFLDMSTTFLTNGGRDLLLLNPGGQEIDFVSYSDNWYQDPEKDDGGYSLELINPLLVCSGAQNWIASNDAIGGTPGLQNSVFDDSPDITPPSVESFNLLTSAEIVLILSESIDLEGLESAQFSIDQEASISTVALIQPDQILITFADGLQIGVAYVLTIEGLTDCEGNQNGQETIDILVGEQPEPGDLSISELMADPTPSVGYPEAEYFELFNKSDKTIELRGCEISGILFEESVILNPGQYVAFSSDENIDLFTGVSGIRFLDMSTSFLTNSGRELVLINADEVELDFVEYSDDWYNNPEKEDGGFSLELINPFLPCSGEFNWTASNDLLGGTPAAQNSVFNDFPDQTAPEVQSVVIDQGNVITVRFSEPLDEASINDIVATFNPDLEVAAVFPIRPDVISIELIPSLEIGVTYVLSLAGIVDCSGNASDLIELEILVGRSPTENEVLITEIMADPSPSAGLPEAEYFELYNNSDVAIELLNCDLSGYIFEAPFVLPAGEYAYFTSQSNQILFLVFPEANFLEDFSTSFFTNSGKELEFRNPDGILVDRVNYSIDWYNDSDKEDGGFSLERINLDEPCRGASNWTGSNAEGGGTPGLENSVFDQTPDQSPPNLTAVFAQSENLIEVRFDEVLDSLSIFTSDVSIIPELAIGAILNSPPEYNSIFIEIPGGLEEGIQYALTISGVTDCTGNVLQQSDLFPFALPQNPEDGDLLINEVLFNPRTNGRDFVEIYNASEKNIGLQNWLLQNGDLTTRVITEDPFIIYPGQHLALTDDVSATLQEYPMSAAFPDNFLEMESLPSYNNGDGTVILADPFENEVDRFDYLEDYHFPLLNSFDGVSLERLSYTRPTNDEGNWSSASERVGFATPGYVNSQFLAEGRANAKFELQDEVFSPDNDGFEDVLLINYAL